MNSPSSRQRGATLVVGMIMLILISLLAVASFKLGKSDLQIVGNMQQRKQALAAAQQTTEQVISSTQFTATPTDALPSPCGGVKNTACVDVNGDGVVDVNVKVVVTCAALVPILNNTPNLPHSCLKGVDQTNGVVGALTGDSLCSNTVWDVQATATDAVTNAQYVVDQGVATQFTENCP
jgi:Tfp pilus assembly protein PilX